MQLQGFRADVTRTGPHRSSGCRGLAATSAGLTSGSSATTSPALREMEARRCCSPGALPVAH
jgi:hypothetical protein